MQLNLFDTEDQTSSPEGLTKVCRYCEKKLPLRLFQIRYKDYKPEGVQGRNHICNPCFKASQQKVRELKKSAPHQPLDRKCECCGGTVGTFFFDHCHETEVFRGWLCRSCNVGLGFLGDNIKGVEKALTYLRKHDERS